MGRVLCACSSAPSLSDRRGDLFESVERVRLTRLNRLGDHPALVDERGCPFDRQLHQNPISIIEQGERRSFPLPLPRSPQSSPPPPSADVLLARIVHQQSRHGPAGRCTSGSSTSNGRCRVGRTIPADRKRLPPSVNHYAITDSRRKSVSGTLARAAFTRRGAVRERADRRDGSGWRW